MDDLHTEKSNVTPEKNFLAGTNELLLSSSYFEIFAFQWLELLEEGYGFSPAAISISHSGFNKVISLDSSFEQKIIPLKGSKFSSGAILDEMKFLPANPFSPQSFFVFDASLKSHPLAPVLEFWAPFYLSLALKNDTLTRKFRLASLSRELSEILSKTPDTVSLLSGLQSFLTNEHLFLWHVHKETFLATGKSQPILKSLDRPLTDILLQTRYERNMYTNECYQKKLNGLILYPVYADDLIAILGSFSVKPMTVSDLDISMMVEFCANAEVVRQIEKELC